MNRDEFWADRVLPGLSETITISVFTSTMEVIVCFLGPSVSSVQDHTKTKTLPLIQYEKFPQNLVEGCDLVQEITDSNFGAHQDEGLDPVFFLFSCI